MKKVISLLLTVLVLFSITSCADIAKPKYSEASGDAVASFSVDLLKNMWNDNENTLVSPVLTLKLLSDVADSVGGDTVKVIESVTNIPQNKLDAWLEGYLNDTESSEEFLSGVIGLAWAEPYYKNDLSAMKFIRDDYFGGYVNTMQSYESLYLEDENSAGVLKYYDGEKYAFVAVLPTRGVKMADYIAKLSGEKLMSLLDSAREAVVLTKLPNFSDEVKTDITSIFEKRGLDDVTRLRNDNDPANNIVFKLDHYAVEERVIEPGIIDYNCMEENTDTETHYPVFDRPFLYMVIDCENNIPILLGTAVDMDFSYSEEGLIH